MKNQSTNDEKYSITGFSDLVGSPVFYSVLVLTVILGLASAFGFFQNPRKLKLIIDLISQRIFISKAEQAFEKRLPSTVVSDYADVNTLLPTRHDNLQIIYKRTGQITASSLNEARYSLFAKDFALDDKPVDSMTPIALDYNISSRNFWRSLNTKEPGDIIMAAPITMHSNRLDKDYLRYSLKVSRNTL